MALSRLTYNSLNVTPAASKGIGFDAGADDLSTDFTGGDMRFIKKLTSDGSDDDLSFVDGASDVVLDSTYKEYLFIFNNIHPETDDVEFQFQGSIDSGSNYNVAMTTTTIDAYHGENDLYPTVQFNTAEALAQGTGYQALQLDQGNANDESIGGYLHLFNPSSTTFVKHFIAKNTRLSHNDYLGTLRLGGYFNTTSAIDAIQFNFSADCIQAGTITLYGIN